MPTPTLTTRDEFKLHLGIPESDTSEDDLLDQLLVGVEEAAKRYTKRGFLSEAATEYYDGHGGDTLPLRRRPVTAVASVHVHSTGYAGQGDDPFPASTLWLAGSDYYLPRSDESEDNAGLLIAIHGCWPIGRGNIKVVNTAGYSAVPENVKLAIHQLTAAVRNGREQGAIKAGETIGRYAYQLLQGGVKQLEVVEARAILSAYCD